MATSVSGELVERRGEDPGVSASGAPLAKTAGIGGGGFSGGEVMSRELATWRPRIASADQTLNSDKLILDARGRDLIRNTGPMLGASNVHQDSIVGSQYRINLDPAVDVLRRATGITLFDDTWAEEFQQEVEELFTLYAESDDTWIDVSRTMTFTDMIRMAVCSYFAGGEVVGTCNWMKGYGRPFSTAFQLIDPDRVCNPNDMADTKFLKRGVVLDAAGAPTALHIRKGYSNDPTAMADAYTWERRDLRFKWGRANAIYIRRSQRVEQTRGTADMVSVLKEARMTDRFHETTLTNAIVNASYAATIESELPPDMAFEMLGGGAGGSDKASMAFLTALAEYSRGGTNMTLDGVKIPHLFPGAKLKMLPAGTVGGVGTGFEESLNRYISAGLGISYEEYTHDFTKTNYSSAKAAANNTLRSMQARKRQVADRVANLMFRNWFEEAMESRMIESLNPMLQRNKNIFYEGMNKDALCRATWIGSSRGQVDELKETQAALLRIRAGLSTYEDECARLGKDFRDVFRQRQREDALARKYNLTFQDSPTKPGTLSQERDTATTSGDGNDDDTDE